MTNIEKLLIDNGFDCKNKDFGSYQKGPIHAFVFVTASYWDVSIGDLCFNGETTPEEMKAECDETKHAIDMLFEIAKKLNALENPWDEAEEKE